MNFWSIQLYPRNMFQSNEMIFPLDSVQPFVFFYRNLDFEILKEFYIKTRWLSNFLPPADKCNLLSPENCLENDNIFVKRRTFHMSEIYIITKLAKIIIKHRKNCECCHHHSLFKGHNVTVNIVVLNCQK